MLRLIKREIMRPMITELHRDPAMVYNVKIDIGDADLAGHLAVPETATGLVIFAHGSGSSRFSPRNNFVARQLQRMGIATFLLDLLTPAEEYLVAKRFNIHLLAERLVIATRFVQQEGYQCHTLPVGYFGASTGAAAAFVAAAILRDEIGAVVSRGGRPDLAGEYLQRVTAPSLLIAGALDEEVLELNRRAMTALKCTRKLSVIPGATHLFPEPSALEQVAELSGKWFNNYLTQPAGLTTNTIAGL